MNRKDTLNSLFLTKPEVASPSSGKAPERVRSGAIAAMGSTLQEMAEAARVVERLQSQLVNSESVVSLDPAQIDGSSVTDRIIIDVDPGFETLVASIEANGQQVPILVRPHPEHSGRFQIAYGRRRLRAAQKLGRPVKAIVHPLSDVELVVAQGRENSDRADLSFIEKAFFAKNLEDAGFDRPTIVAALATDKADVSRYIAVARNVPEDIVRRIGPAGKAGRARWLSFAKKIEDERTRKKIEQVLEDPEFSKADSDRRFQAVWKITETPSRTQVSRPNIWQTPKGKRAGVLEQSGRKSSLVFNETVVPDFAAFIATRLDALYEEFSHLKEENGE